MDPIFRANLTRIVLTGSESTGKTTLAAQLAAHYHVEFVPEFVREFAERTGQPVVLSDHDAIARGQMALENQYAARADTLLFKDADLLSTVAYCRHYTGSCPRWIEDEARKRQPNLYMLAYIDTPWVADGIRDRGDRREEMHQVFIDTLTEFNARYVALRGLGAERKQNAIRFVDAVIKG